MQAGSGCALDWFRLCTVKKLYVHTLAIELVEGDDHLPMRSGKRPVARIVIELCLGRLSSQCVIEKVKSNSTQCSRKRERVPVKVPCLLSEHVGLRLVARDEAVGTLDDDFASRSHVLGVSQLG